MPKVSIKKIRERVNRMNTAWAQGALGVDFNGITQSDFQANIQTAAATDQEIADLKA